MSQPRFSALEFTRRPPEEIVRRAREFYDMTRRCTTRQFSSEPVPREGIELAIRTAGTATTRRSPSGSRPPSSSPRFA